MWSATMTHTASNWILILPIRSLHFMPEQNGIEDIGGTLRLGSYPCVLDKSSKAYKLYGEETIHERHRHRYEVNNDYRKVLTENGMMLSGLSPDGRIVEMVETSGSPVLHRNTGSSGTEVQPEPSASAVPWIRRSRCRKTRSRIDMMPGIVGVRRTEQSAGIINLTSQNRVGGGD